MRRLEKAILLHVLDGNWREHLQQLDHLRSVVWMRGHAQRDPINEFKTEAFALFEGLLDGLRRDVVRTLMHMQVRTADEAPPIPQPRRVGPTSEVHLDPLTGENEMAEPGDVALATRPRAAAPRTVGSPRKAAGVGTMAAQVRAKAVDAADPATWAAAPRNSPCPCGSGKKFKHCHGAI